MPLRLLAALLAAALAGCASGPSVVPSVPLDGPTALFTLDVPDGYRVVSATADPAVSGTDTQTSSRVYLSVLAEHVATGERALLVYQNVHKRTSPVAVFRFRPEPERAAGGPAPTRRGGSWSGGGE